MLKLDVVIVNWNAGNQLRDCLQSIKIACSESVYQVSRCLVVDNASTDGSTDSLEGISLPYLLINNSINKGFGSASNLGAAYESSEYILFLNPDVRLYKDSVKKALSFLGQPQNNQIGILGIQLVDENDVVHRSTSRLPTPGSLTYEMIGLDRMFPALFPPRIMTDWDHQVSRYVDHVEGSFFLVRRKVFEELSGFDERFFLYFEDVDFSFRAKLAGWKSYYLAEVKAFHRGAGTTDRIKARRLFYWFRGRFQYVAKHFGQPAAWEILISSLSVEFVARVCVNLIKLNWRYLFETLQAYGLYLKAIPSLLRELYGRN
jgi:N-acetylglucosaminyl-diphospho-decaprenol L-rhamnosyltransferase